MAEFDFSQLDVLVVDDNRHMRTLFRDILHSLGVGQVLEANNGMNGFRQLRPEFPDIIITDLMMQPVNGLQFAKLVRNEKDSPHPYVPIIMVTGFADRQRVKDARDAGVTEFLAKPVTPEALYARLVSIIEQPRPFVRTGDFFGPDRRRRAAMSIADGGRRAEDASEPATGETMSTHSAVRPETAST